MNEKSVVMPLIIVNFIFFIIQISFKGFTSAFMLIPSDIFLRPWILITSMFLHANISHIFYNMYGLLLFGPLLESKIGPKKFLFLYITCGITAGLGHVFLSYVLYGEAHAALGASGALMGVIGTLIILMPNLMLLFFFFVPMPLWVAGIIWAFLDFIGVLIPNKVANIAHLVGLSTGLLYGLYLKNKKKNFHKKFSTKMHLSKEDIDEFLKFGKI